MENSSSICSNPRNLTCRPKDYLTVKQELERKCQIYMLILLSIAIIVGCLLIVTVRSIDRYWCPPRRRVFRPIPQRRPNRSDHYVTSIMGGIAPPRAVSQGEIPVQQEEIQL